MLGSLSTREACIDYAMLARLEAQMEEQQRKQAKKTGNKQGSPTPPPVKAARNSQVNAPTSKQPTPPPGKKPDGIVKLAKELAKFSDLDGPESAPAAPLPLKLLKPEQKANANLPSSATGVKPSNPHAKQTTAPKPAVSQAAKAPMQQVAGSRLANASGSSNSKPTNIAASKPLASTGVKRPREDPPSAGGPVAPASKVSKSLPSINLKRLAPKPPSGLHPVLGQKPAPQQKQGTNSKPTVGQQSALHKTSTPATHTSSTSRPHSQPHSYPATSKPAVTNSTKPTAPTGSRTPTPGTSSRPMQAVGLSRPVSKPTAAGLTKQTPNSAHQQSKPPLLHNGHGRSLAQAKLAMLQQQRRPGQVGPSLAGKRPRDEDDEYDSDFVVDSDVDEDPDDWRKELRRMTGYDPRKYRDERFDDRMMEASWRDIEAEERRAARIGREEDEAEEEAERRHQEEKARRKVAAKKKAKAGGKRYSLVDD